MAATTPRERTPDVGIRTMIAGDGVRGIGMLLVFATHLFLLADPEPNNNMLSYGRAAPLLGHIDLGLAAFFVLSGYLIARPFARAYVAGTRRPGLRSYVRNRALRIVPAFYVFTVLVLARFGLDGRLGDAPGADTSAWWQVLGQFAFVQGQTGGPAAVPIGPAWSIGAEVGFYALIPAVAYAAYRAGARLRTAQLRAALGLGVLGLITFASIAVRALDKYHFAWLTSPPAIMYVFMPGVAVALLEPLVAGRLRDRARAARALAWAAFAVGLLAAVAYGASDYDPRQTPIHHALGQRALLAALSTGALIAGLVALQLGTGGAPRAFSNRFVLWMGARSYSFYLAHIWVLLEIDHALGGEEGIAQRLAVMAAVGLPVTTAIAALSYRWVERPFLERKLRTTQHAAAEATPAALEPAR